MNACWISGTESIFDCVLTLGFIIYLVVVRSDIVDMTKVCSSGRTRRIALQGSLRSYNSQLYFQSTIVTVEHICMFPKEGGAKSGYEYP